MINVKLYLTSNDDWLSEDVHVSFKLPAIPSIGERIFLSDELYKELEDKIKHSPAILEYIEWFNGKTYYLTRDDRKMNELYETGMPEENLEDLDIGDASYVTSVLFRPNDDTVYIQIGNGLGTDW